MPRPVPGELARPRLLARLEAARDARLVVLAAPSGFGKTTLMAQHARGSGRPVAWLSLGEDDADPAVLAASLAEATEQAMPGLELGRLRAEPPFAAPGRLARALARDLGGAAENLLLVLDHGERLGHEAGGWLEALLGELPEGHQLMLAGYDPLRLRVARLAASGTAVVLGADDLAYTLEESAAFLRGRGYDGDPAAAHGSLEGWPVGLGLVATGAAGLAPADLVLEALAALPGELRAGLAEAGVLETWSEAAVAGLGAQLPENWLENVRRAGLPVAPLGGGFYRPHRLLLGALDAELRRRPLRHAELHLLAAWRAEGAGDPLEALGHFRAAGATPDALRLAGDLAARYEARGEPHLARRVLEPLAPHLPPGLARLLGTALLETGEPDRGEAVLRGLRERGEAGARGAVALGQRAARAGRYAEALDLAREGAALAGNELETALARMLEAVAMWGQGRHEEMEVAAGTAVALLEARADPAGRMALARGLFLLGSAENAAGHHREAAARLAAALAVYEAQGTPLPALAVRNDLANLHRLAGRFEAAGVELERALALAEEAGHLTVPILLGSRADLKLWRGDLEEAAAGYRAAVARAEEAGLRVTAADNRLRLAEVARRLGRTEEAEAALESARRAAAEPGAPAHLGGGLALQDGLLALGRDDEAGARAAFERAGGADPADRLRARLYLAELDRRAGWLERPALTPVVAALDEFGSDAALRLDAGALAALHAEAVERGWWSQRFGRPADPPAVAAAGVPLEVRTLGRLEVSVGGVPVRLPFARCGELLAWLALRGPATRDAVVADLWNGLPDRRHLEYFRVTVRRLRAALAEAGGLDLNPLPYEGGLYRLSERLSLRLDAQELADALESGEPAALEAALEGYRGEFLPQAEGGWAGIERARCLSLAVEVALALGAALEATAPLQAARAYRRAVEIEPLSEAAHAALVAVLERRGDSGGAERARRDWRRALEAGLRPEAF